MLWKISIDAQSETYGQIHPQQITPIAHKNPRRKHCFSKSKKTILNVKETFAELAFACMNSLIYPEKLKLGKSGTKRHRSSSIKKKYSDFFWPPTNFN